MNDKLESEGEHEAESSDSEDDEQGVWLDDGILGNRDDNKSSEPFSLGLDMLWPDENEQPPTMDTVTLPEASEDERHSEPAEITEEPELSQTHEDETDFGTELDIDPGTETGRVHRLRRVPLRLTYDTLGNPSITATAAVRHVCCF